MIENGRQRTIITTDDRTLSCDKFIPFGIDNEAIAICEDVMYLKQGDGKYRNIAPFRNKNNK